MQRVGGGGEHGREDDDLDVRGRSVPGGGRGFSRLRRRRRGVPGREGDDRAVPLRGLDEEALLRRDALEGRLYGRREGARGGVGGPRQEAQMTKQVARGRLERR